MTYFLERIAGALYNEFGNTLNRHCLVFPSRRAGLYFLRYLSACTDRPVWVPAIMTISDLFRSFSPLQVPGNELLLAELYKVYRELRKTAESFDEFYFWGDMLLDDFDDVDKYLADASLLFRNVEDIKDIDRLFGGLTEEQVEVIRRFWINFNPEQPTKEKKGFINIWSVLFPLYTEFRKSLRQKNLAYEGMIFRDIATGEGDATGVSDGWDRVHFIGFNALNECEKAIMKRYKKAGKALFYWDYDLSYINEGKINSAGYFMRENLERFGNDMPGDWRYDTILSASRTDVSRKVIETSSDVAQVKLITGLISGMPGINPDNAHHTAVVLADENLLLPVLSSLPIKAGDINITMGYPLKQTVVYTLLRHMMDLQNNAEVTEGGIRFNYNDVAAILKHSLITGIMDESEKGILSSLTDSNMVSIPIAFFSASNNLRLIFSRPGDPLSMSEYFREVLSSIAGGLQSYEGDTMQLNIINEFIYRVVLSINRLDTVVRDGDIVFTNETYLRILDRLLRQQTIPFSGEPLSGIQIMGLLETRTLDFKNLVILSVNEGVLPAISAGSSFIPFALREAFRLPSLNHQESIYAYHFYRLLQRAENVTFVYNSNSEGLRNGEMSRFLIQMKYDPSLKPEFLNLNFEIKTGKAIREILPRSEDHYRLLHDMFIEGEKSLSPSAVNTWLNCRMQFYYRYVNGLREPESVTADIDPAIFGNILHGSMKYVYEGYRNEIISNDLLESLIRNRNLLKEITDRSVRENFRKDDNMVVSGNEMIIREILLTYLERILKMDKQYTPFTVLDLESNFSFPLNFKEDGSDRTVITGGIIDRIDICEGTTRIVDYKTGNIADSISSVNDLFNDNRDKSNKKVDGWLQTLIYCEAYISKHEGTKVRPSVYKVKSMPGGIPDDRLILKPDRQSELHVDDYSMVRDEFMEGLKNITGIIFGKNEPFTMTSDKWRKCSFCEYRNLCMR